jgi:transposase
MLIVSDWFEHNRILVMDNAQIHTAGKAECVEYYLWHTIIEGRPLHVKIVYLPTRCPELNPIEFMFNFLSNRVQSFRYQIVAVIDRGVVAPIG